MTPEQEKTLNQIEQKLNDMCVSNTKEHKEIKETIKDIQDYQNTRVLDCEKRFEDRPKYNIFMWIVGGIGATVITLSIIFGGIVISNNKNIATITHELNDHIAFAVIVYEEVTGKKWGIAARDELDQARKIYKETRAKALAVED